MKLSLVGYMKITIWWEGSFSCGKWAYFFNSLLPLHSFAQRLNSIDTYSQITFTMFVDNSKSVLEFLDLSLHIYGHNKICVDVYVKLTKSFTYVLPSTCYPKKSIKKVPKRIALHEKSKRSLRKPKRALLYHLQKHHSKGLIP